MLPGAMKWFWVLLLLAVAVGCDSRKAAPVAAEPAACGSATAAVCGPPPAASPSTIDTAQSEVCKQTCASKDSFTDRDVVPAAHAKVGDLTRCPVSGVVFRVSDHSPRVEHAGSSLRLCCEGCAEKFREQPSRFSGS
jgi:hypothetical protein